MRPVLTVAEMRAADAAALESVAEAVLVRRAGYAAAHEALAMLGGAYGRRVVVVAGKGNNGNDGRVAAGVLARRGARVEVLDAAAAPARIEGCDLVIDAAYGTGFAGTYTAPALAPGVRVLAVDVPSGVHGDTGEERGRALPAERTITFAALKRAHLMGEGRSLCGAVRVADIGVPVDQFSVALVEDSDLAELGMREPDTHKWSSAVCVVAGSPGMEGAAALASRGASRAGAGMVRLGVPGAGTSPGPWPLEAVRLPLAPEGWVDAVLAEVDRCRALVIGPGLGRSDATIEGVRRAVSRSEVPVVVDADGLFALGDADSARAVVGNWERPVVLTPHDGEYRRLTGHDPGPDRVAAARELAEATGAVALLKGSLTAVAAPGPGEGAVLLAGAGGPDLATAGTGDVLSGIIGAFLARGLDAQRAAAYAAHAHGAAAREGEGDGLVSADLPDLVADWLHARTAGRG